jgi:uncharacterized OB-fold protein
MSQDDRTLHSRRTLNLRFNIPLEKTHQFWDALREGRFVTTKCADCGQVSFPPQSDCPQCMSPNHGWLELGTDAELVTFTYVVVTPTSFVDHEPYTVGIGRLDNGVKVLAWVESPPEKLNVGDKLKLEARKAEDGSPYYVFVPRRG